MRSALALAIAGQFLVLVATGGVLNAWTAGIAVLIAMVVAWPRAVAWPPWTVWLLVAALVPIAILASYPPNAFDETMYHLPFVRSLAESGTIRILPEVRYGLLPQLHELLAVPVYLAAGDTATHFIGLAQFVILGFLVMAWPRMRTAGWLAAAIVAGNPLLIYGSTITYVDTALTLFVAAGFFCLDRVEEQGHRYAFLAGFFLGTSTAVKYLGWYFVAAGVLFAWRRLPWYALGVAAGAAPMLARLLWLTGNPLYPMVGEPEYRILGAAPDAATALSRLATLLWDVSFVKERVGFAQPMTPFFALALVATIVLARRWRLALVVVAYLVLFVVRMPADSRFLLPLVPLVAVPAAEAVAARWPVRRVALLALVAAAPLVLYPLAWIHRHGIPPTTDAGREAFLARTIPAYRALRHAGPGRIYTCGGEQLAYFGGDRFLGDHFGPYAYARVFGAADPHRVLAAWNVRWLLVNERACPPEWLARVIGPDVRRVYADEDGELWRMDGIED